MQMHNQINCQSKIKIWFFYFEIMFELFMNKKIKIVRIFIIKANDNKKKLSSKSYIFISNTFLFPSFNRHKRVRSNSL